MQVPTRELEAGVERVDVGRRHNPDGRLSRAVPPDEDRAGGGALPERVGVDAERAPRVAVGHPRAAEESVQAGGCGIRSPSARGVVWKPPQREDREVACRHNVRAVAWPPQLDERRVLPRRWFGPLDARMHREERGSGHAVLQAGPGCAAERAPSGWEAFIERADVPSVCEDLLPSEVETRPRHVTQAAASCPHTAQVTTPQVYDRAVGRGNKPVRRSVLDIVPVVEEVSLTRSNANRLPWTGKFATPQTAMSTSRPEWPTSPHRVGPCVTDREGSRRGVVHPLALWRSSVMVGSSVGFVIVRDRRGGKT